MPGGFIFLKEGITSSSQNNTDKSLLIDPQYAYQVPFSFLSDWSDIKIGMYIGFVKTGAGNEDVGAMGADGQTTVAQCLQAGGITPDTFFYFGLVKEGDTNALPTTANSSGFLGIQSDLMRINSSNISFTSNNLANSQKANKFTNAQYDPLSSQGLNKIGNGTNKIIASSGSTILDSSIFNASEGNFNIAAMTGTSPSLASPQRDDEFCAYWGVRFQVVNKGAANQGIKITSSYNSVNNGPGQDNAISDPSSASLVNLLNGIGEHSFPSPNDGVAYEWNQGGTAMPLPDSLFIYNGFPNMRPRIHTWAAKKSS